MNTETTTPVPANLWAGDEQRKAKNQERAVARGLPSCEMCGRGVGLEKGWVVEILGGSVIALPGTADESDSAYMGAWLLGPECGKAVPAAFRVKADASWALDA